MEDKMNKGYERERFWEWYKHFWEVWAILIGAMVISRLLRGQGLYYANSSSMIGNVMWAVVQILTVFCSPLLLFDFAKGLDKKGGKIKP